VVEDEDNGEAELLCYMLEENQPESSIKIKEFMG